MSDIINKIAPPKTLDISLDLTHPRVTGRDGLADMRRVGTILNLISEIIAETGVLGDIMVVDGKRIAHWVIHVEGEDT